MTAKAGEDLEEIEEEDEDVLPHDEEGGLRRSLFEGEATISSIHFTPDLTKPHDETTPLIQSTISKGTRHGSRMRRKRAGSVSGGDASVTDAVLMVCLRSLFLCFSKYQWSSCSC